MRLPLVVLLAIAAALVGLLARALGVLAPLDHLLFDARMELCVPTPAPDRVRVVVATDDDLGMLPEWPWDRSVYAQLALCLREAGASGVALDFTLDSPGRSAEGDEVLGRTAREQGGVVVGAFFDIVGVRGLKPVAMDRLERHSVAVPAGARFPAAARVLWPVDPIVRDGAAVAFLTAPHDGDGKIRRVWLLLEYQSRLFPSLPLSLYLTHAKKRLSDVRVDDAGNLALPRADGGWMDVPLDAEGALLLDPAPQDAYPVRSFSGIFHLYESGGAAALSDYSGLPVVVGNTMTASTDVRSSAREPQTYGCFLHAAALAQLVEGRYLRTGGPLLQGLAMLGLGLLGAWMGARWRGPWQALAGLLVLVLPLGAAALIATLWRVTPPLADPMLSGLLAWGAAATVRAISDARHRRRVEGVFQGFLPAPVLAQVLADPGQDWARPQRREGALLFARVVRRDAGRLAPEEDAALLGVLFGTAVEAIAGQGGTVVRLDLDRIVAVFGAPVALEDPAEAAMRAAFTLREAWRRHSAEWVDRLGAPLEASFALHSGILTVGPVGGEQHREYAVFGAEAEFGFRLLERAAPDQVLASDRLQSLVTASADSAVVDQSEDGRNLFELSPST